uniref:ZP domain-containing protein n=1 Tax=Plectus sambesii TaxID=2011161 RepID=A0A914VNC4_9BILA
VGGSDARIGRCWAKDNTSEIELSDDRGCSLQTTGNVWGSFKSENSGAEGRVFYNDIKAWAFPTSNKVNILCNLHLCA